MLTVYDGQTVATAIRIMYRWHRVGVHGPRDRGNGCSVRGYDEPVSTSKRLMALQPEAVWTTIAAEDRPTAEDIGTHSALAEAAEINDDRQRARLRGLKREMRWPRTRVRSSRSSLFLAMPEEAFREAFAIRVSSSHPPGTPAGTAETWLFADELSRRRRRPS